METNPHPALCCASGCSLFTGLSHGFDVIFPGKATNPPGHLQLEERGKNLGRSELGFQKIENLVDLQALVGMQNLQDHGLIGAQNGLR